MYTEILLVLQKTERMGNWGRALARVARTSEAIGNQYNNVIHCCLKDSAKLYWDICEKLS
jgi:hypothetical protein